MRAVGALHRQIFAVILLTLFWVALWEDITFANVLGGMLIGCLAVYIVPSGSTKGRLTLRPLAALHLLVFFLWELLKASLVVAWEVLTPRDHTNQKVVVIPISSTDPFMITSVANAVSLIPGTLVLDVRDQPTRLYLHVLHHRTDDEVLRSISRLEDLAAKALLRPPQEAIADVSDPSGGSHWT